MKKIFATAALAVVLSAGAAAPAFAGDNQANSDSQTNSTNQTNHSNPGALNGNQLHVGSVQVPVNVSCNGVGVSAVGDATGAAKDC
ncbi:MAG TPA: hypothetical protein VHU91_11075, partial [Mycobacteriales bacterium]|nr:hypothetical protein [Mycobacteriales bacterium]